MNDFLSVKEMWPRPRVGQFVRLKKNNRWAEVIIVNKARDVLRSKTEMEALLLGPKCQSLYGVDWLEVYYEAIVSIVGSMLQITVTPIDISEIVDRKDIP